jgi:uncharacterized cupin superfamily protein
MPTIFKSEELKFKEDQASIENFKIQTALPRLPTVTKSEHMIFDVRLLNPEQFSFPYHFHRHAEELIYIISGSLTLRTPNGFQVLNKGDIIFFEMKETGAHQLFNHTSEPCTYLDIKTMLENDICEYPDSGKISVSHYREIFEKISQVEYFKGEENIKERWEKLKNNEK